MWDLIPGFMEGVGGDHLVVLEGSWASVCAEGPTVLGLPRYPRGPRGLAYTCDFSPSEFPGGSMSIAHSHAGVSCLLSTPCPPLHSPSLQWGSEEGCLNRNVFPPPPSPACSQKGDLTGQKNLVPWEYELLASAPGPSDRAPSLI